MLGFVMSSGCRVQGANDALGHLAADEVAAKGV